MPLRLGDDCLFIIAARVAQKVVAEPIGVVPRDLAVAQTLQTTTQLPERLRGKPSIVVGKENEEPQREGQRGARAYIGRPKVGTA
jgi:hypothetical protein